MAEVLTTSAVRGKHGVWNLETLSRFVVTRFDRGAWRVLTIFLKLGIGPFEFCRRCRHRTNYADAIFGKVRVAAFVLNDAVFRFVAIQIDCLSRQPRCNFGRRVIVPGVTCPHHIPEIHDLHRSARRER